MLKLLQICITGTIIFVVFCLCSDIAIFADIEQVDIAVFVEPSWHGLRAQVATMAKSRCQQARGIANPWWQA